MQKVIAIGEVLIDFTECGVSANGQRLFEQNPGGAPANFLTALSRQGVSTGFIGKVGDDLHGHFLQRVLADEGIDTSGLKVDSEAFTTLAFVALAPNGERSFSFARKPGADTQLRADEIDEATIASAQLLHFGSLSLTAEPSRSAIWKALEVARSAGVLVSYDPNYRPLLWPSEAAAVAQMKSVLGQVDLLKVSDDEATLLTGHHDSREAAGALLAYGPRVVVVTKGEMGAELYTQQFSAVAQGFKANSVDTTGAGDCFWGSFIGQLIAAQRPVETLTQQDYAAFLAYANAAASLCVEQRGGIPAMPNPEMILKRMTSAE